MLLQQKLWHHRSYAQPLPVLSTEEVSGFRNVEIRCGPHLFIIVIVSAGVMPDMSRCQITRSTRFAPQVGIIKPKPNPNPKTLTLILALT